MPNDDQTFLPFRTERLLLRTFHLGDAEVFGAYRDDPEVARYQDWAQPFTAELARDFVAGQVERVGPVPGDWVQIAIEYDGQMIGDVAVGLDAEGWMAMIGYTLRRDWQGQGFATEAVEALVDRLFGVTGVRRVSA